MSKALYINMIRRLNTLNYFRTSRASLDNIQQITSLLGNPQDKLKFIHIAGTNGKGTVTLQIQKALQYSGYRTGLFISPHLFTFRERIMINDHMIEEDYFVQVLDDIFNLTEKHKIQLTFFEYLTCLSFMYFKEMNVDFISLETGLGGKLDSTNIINTTLLSVITSIGYDHMQVLGNTLEQIAKEKAGIIKPNRPVVIGPNAKPYEIFQNIAKQQKSDLVQVILPNKQLSLIEENQLISEISVNELIKRYGIQIKQDNMQKALNQSQLCRLQLIKQSINTKCQVYVDVGHNVSAIEKVLKSIPLQNQDLRVIFGTSSMKDSKEILKILLREARDLHLVQANHFRSMDIIKLQNESYQLDQNYKKIKVISGGNIQSTIQNVLTETTQNSIVLICGSFFLMSEVFAAFNIPIIQDPPELNLKINLN